MARSRTNMTAALADDTIPPLDADATDVEQLVWLLEVARKRGYKLGPTVQINTVIVQVTDVRQIQSEAFFAATNSDAGPSDDIWTEHGHDPNEAPSPGTTGR